MAYIRKRLDKFTVAIRRKHGQRIYKTFNRKSDALRFAKETASALWYNGWYREEVDIEFSEQTLYKNSKKYWLL